MVEIDGATSKMLSVEENGTAVDAQTGLIWLVRTLDPMPWNDATQSFGRAQILPDPSPETWSWRFNSEDSVPGYLQLTRKAYADYEIGKRKLEYAGSTDWRLPTVQELGTVARKIRSFTLDCSDDMREQLKPWRVSVWAANPSDCRPKGLGSANWISKKWPSCAWQFSHNPEVMIPNLDQKNEFAVRLVRAGLLFQSTSV